MSLIFAILILVAFNLILGAVVTPLPMNDRRTVRYGSFPFMTVGLIVVNSAVFGIWQAPDIIAFLNAETPIELNRAIQGYNELVINYGFRGMYLREGISIGAWTTFTSMFMHSDFNHLVGNMIFLWAFGRRLEDACGPWRFLIFYLVAGMIANMGTAILASSTDLPGVGASGAIFGVMGGYLLLFPFAWMGCLWVPLIPLKWIVRQLSKMSGDDDLEKWKWTVQIPAIVVVVLYVGFNLLPTFETAGTGELSAGVNYVAHMTGFLSAVMIFLFVRKDLYTRYWSGRAI